MSGPVGRADDAGIALEHAGIVLYGKPGCHLCDEAKPLVERLAAEFQLPVAVANILDDARLFDAYRYRIPVVRWRGRLLDEGRVTEARLRAGLRSVLSRAASA